MNSLADVLVVLFCVVTVLVAISFVFEFDRWRIVAWLQTPLPLWIPLAGAGTVLALLASEYLVGAVLGLATAIFVFRLVPLLQSTLMHNTRPTAAKLRVAHGNLLYLNTKYDDTLDALITVDADVLTLCEVTETWHGKLLEHVGFHSLYPHRVICPADLADGIAVFSKINFETHSIKPMITKNAVVATLSHPSGRLQLITPHPMPPVSRIKIRDWRPSFESIRRSVDPALPTLLIGDLNAAHWHPSFRHLVNDGFLRHVRSGVRGRWAGGLAPSWRPHRKAPRIVRLDHALISSGLHATDVSSFTIPGSDHDGLVVEVTFRD